MEATKPASENKKKMKSRFSHTLATLACAASAFFMQGCGPTGQNDKEAFRTIVVEESAPLDVASATSPTCEMVIDYQYPTAQSQTDSITPLINTTVQARLLGEAYALLPPAAAVDSFKNDYIRRYRDDIIGFYREDLERIKSPEEMPQWYNYEMRLTTRYADGRKGILNFTSERMEYTGGAHPNTWGMWLNFRQADGRVLTLDEVFPKESHPQLIALLTERLIAHIAKQMEDKDIRTVDDLNEYGVLNTTDMYVSENFLLEADGAAFLYNRYDIAPYAAGAIELRLPYAEVEHIINLSF